MLKHVHKPQKSAVLRTYWQFAAKRQKLFFDRLYGVAGSNDDADPVLAKHRFTNVYRASDRVSQYLIRHVQYNKDWSDEDLLFRTLLFKFFNKIETWEGLERRLGAITWENYDFALLDECLSEMRRSGAAIYSAAYIMPSGKSAFGHDAKHQNHLKLLELIMADDGARRIPGFNDLESVYQYILSFPTIGPFTGYQYTIDLNYSPLVRFEEAEFVVAGPGALDGIRKCFTDLGSYSAQDIINYMYDIQEDEFERYAPDFKSLWGRRMQPIDCQNVFCEVDKYARVVHPEISGVSGRKRIKQIYKRNERPPDAPWYPPKWSLNEAIANDSNVIRKNQQDRQEPLQLSLSIDPFSTG